MSDLGDRTIGADKAALLNQLRIDRTLKPPSSGKGKWWITAAVLLMGAAGRVKA
jgi:hypothetical protein